jgi:hypothetical protein
MHALAGGAFVDQQAMPVLDRVAARLQAIQKNPLRSNAGLDCFRSSSV